MKQKPYNSVLKDYNRVMKTFEFVNYVYLDQIQKFEFKYVSKYIKSKNIFNKIVYDFELTNKLLNEGDILNAISILRNTYENIMYIIATSYDKTFKVKIGSSPGDYRTVLENNCKKLFSNMIEKEDFNNIYKYLCKVLHPSSLKELMSYLENTKKYNMVMTKNIKYIMVLIEYIYLDFLLKRLNRKSELCENLIRVSSYIAVVNIIYFLQNCNLKYLSQRKFLYLDVNSEYIKNACDGFNDFRESLIKDEKEILKELRELAKETDVQIIESEYKETFTEILSDKIIK